MGSVATDYPWSIRNKRITLVLGAGGPVGHAFHTGLLQALSEGLGWDPRGAELVLGTSAGAQVAALLRGGMSAADLGARVTGEVMTPEGAAIADCFTRPSYEHPDADTRPYRPASMEYVLAALRRPWRARPALMFSALLPTGRVCLKPQAEGLRRLFGDEWPERSLWITAACLRSGERLTFGRDGGPLADVGTAVASSGAVPSLCIPFDVGGRKLVDGGMISATHLDLVEDTDDDLVIVSSPLSMITPMRLLLHTELRRLRRSGKRVIAFEPKGELARVMGKDPMDIAKAPAVARAARLAFLQQLEHGKLRGAFD